MTFKFNVGRGLALSGALASHFGYVFDYIIFNHTGEALYTFVLCNS